MGGFPPHREAEPYGADLEQRRARLGLERHLTQTRLIEWGR